MTEADLILQTNIFCISVKWACIVSWDAFYDLSFEFLLSAGIDWDEGSSYGEDGLRMFMGC